MGQGSALAAIVHEEHQRTLALLSTLDERIRGRAERQPLDGQIAGDRQLIERLSQVVEEDIIRHFAAEEALLFPLVQDTLGQPVVLMLMHEHDEVGALASSLAAIAAEAAGGPLPQAAWTAFRETAETFIDQEIFHIQKEEASALQVLPMLLSAEDDAAAAERYRALAFEAGVRTGAPVR
jgi:hemerythrin-like domain-containing protein